MSEVAPRARVDLVLGWRAVGGRGRIYRHRDAAYYEIAKKLVLDKYPPSLTDYNGPTDVDRVALGLVGGDAEWFERRVDKAHELFCYPPGQDYHGAFDSRRFQRFVKRVARFLMFVDDRRFRSHLHEQYESAMEKAGAGAEAYRYRKDDPR